MCFIQHWRMPLIIKYLCMEWASSKYTVTEKPKTVILLDENQNALGFGKDAKHKYVLFFFFFYEINK